MSENLSQNIGDFATTKAALVEFVRSQGKFTEYDTAGSNMSALLDILAYNTYLNLVQNHIGINETFRSTARLRRNVVSRAEEVNYVPRSFRSSTATIRVVITSSQARGAIAIPKGTAFTTRVDNRVFTFTTSENNIAEYTATLNGMYIFTADVVVHEGVFVTDTYIYSPGQTFVLTNERVDTTSLNVSVIEDGGAVVTGFQRVGAALDLTSTTPAFFLTTQGDSKYAIMFGDGVSGREPKTGSSIVAQYRVSSGRLPNGAKVFKPGQPIDGETDIAVETLLTATSGDVYETVDQIKFNAANSLRTQERAAGEEDYSSLLQRENSDIIDVIATGGEQLSPPQYGKVFLSIASNQYSKLPDSRKNELTTFLRKRSMMQPVIIDPETVFLKVSTQVNFDSKATSVTARDIKSFVVGQIAQYASTNLGKFASKLVWSKFVAAIDNAHPSITGNDTTIDIIREFSPAVMAGAGVASTMSNQLTSLTSSSFIYGGRSSKIVSDDTDLHIINTATGERLTSFPIGTFDPATGEFTIQPIAVSASSDIQLIGSGHLATITTPPNTILSLRDNDVTVNIV